MVYPEGSAADRAEMMSFVRVAEWLRAQGLNAPKVYAYDKALASAQIAFLGADAFGDLRRAGADLTPQYEVATDVLRAVKEASPPDFLPPFKGSKIEGRLRSQFIDYYVSFVQRQRTGEEKRAAFSEAWEKMESALPLCPQTMQLMDFHLENLIWCPEEEGLRQCGLIDFQDAALGPMPYDLVNLLEDARVDVSPALKADLIERFCTGMSAEERSVFDAWYAVMALHFHCRVLGLFIMVAVERGRDEFLSHINRLQNYIAGRIDHPALAPVTAWFAQEGLDFAPRSDLNGDDIRQSFPKE